MVGRKERFVSDERPKVLGFPETVRLNRLVEKHRSENLETFRASLKGPFLLIDPNSSESQVFDIGAHFTGDQVVMGRDPLCGVIVTEPSVSRHHAGLNHNGRSWTLTDLRSTNGTFLGERLVPFRSVALENRTMFRIGDILFIQFLEIETLYELLEKSWKGKPVEDETHRTTINQGGPDSRRTTQRQRLTRRHTVPVNLIRQQRAQPRPMRRFIEEVREMSCKDFLKTFPHPFLMLLSVKEGLGADSSLDTQEVAGVSAPTKLSHVAFWVLASENENSCLTVGRDSDNDIVIKHPSVSRFHVRIASAPMGEAENWTIEDLGSTNGAHVDGEKVSGYANLGDQALIRLGGDCLLQFMTPLKLYEFTRLFAEYPHVDL